MAVEWVGPGGAMIREITDAESPDLPKLVNLFQKIFSEYDNYVLYLRLSADHAHPPRAATLDHLWLVEKEGVPVGFRLFSYLPARGFGFGAYTGVLPSMRGSGIGRWLMAQTLNQVLDDARRFGHADPLGCCVEIMRVEPTQTETEQQRNATSLAFHTRCGAVLLDVPYRELQIGWDDIQAGVTDTVGVPKHLAMYHAPGRTRLTTDEQLTVIDGIYLDVYLQTPDHSVYDRVKQGILGEDTT
ncbi:MAG: GNAT family N-acetyltransferase [Chloroflexota bacterium]|nr:GNAT family N-acetyltransferase [Chloroflexota bacterium]